MLTQKIEERIDKLFDPSHLSGYVSMTPEVMADAVQKAHTWHLEYSQWDAHVSSFRVCRELNIDPRYCDVIADSLGDKRKSSWGSDSYWPKHIIEDDWKPPMERAAAMLASFMATKQKFVPGGIEELIPLWEGQAIYFAMQLFIKNIVNRQLSFVDTRGSVNFPLTTDIHIEKRDDFYAMYFKTDPKYPMTNLTRLDVACLLLNEVGIPSILKYDIEKSLKEMESGTSQLIAGRLILKHDDDYWIKGNPDDTRSWKDIASYLYRTIDIVDTIAWGVRSYDTDY